MWNLGDYIEEGRHTILFSPSLNREISRCIPGFPRQHIDIGLLYLAKAYTARYTLLVKHANPMWIAYKSYVYGFRKDELREVLTFARGNNYTNHIVSYKLWAYSLRSGKKGHGEVLCDAKWKSKSTKKEIRKSWAMRCGKACEMHARRKELYERGRDCHDNDKVRPWALPTLSTRKSMQKACVTQSHGDVYMNVLCN